MKICKLNENTEITSFFLNNLVPMNLDGFDDNDIGVNYEKDDHDEIENGCNDIDNSYVNKSSLNEYKLSQYSILSSTSNVSST